MGVGVKIVIICGLVVGFGWWLRSVVGNKEARILAQLWNYTDYFNDPRLDKQMKTKLLSYIDTVGQEEIGRLAKNLAVENYSQELIALNKVVDAIKFDDGRDAAIYPVDHSRFC